MEKIPGTPAIHFLRRNGVEFEIYFYKYEKAGAKFAADQLGMGARLMVKTLVMEDENGVPFIMLMRGDKDVSTKELARKLNVKNVSTCSSNKAQKYTGYKVGGISPFGTRRKMPVYIEETLLELPELYIKAGRRGFLVKLSPKELARILDPKVVSVAV